MSLYTVVKEITVQDNTYASLYEREIYFTYLFLDKYEVRVQKATLINNINITFIFMHVVCTYMGCIKHGLESSFIFCH